jgi:hypothetical protein
MSQVKFEPTIPGFQLAKTVRALDRVATVIDTLLLQMMMMMIIIIIIIIIIGVGI